MRRVGKQIVAITLAAAMMGSLTPEACTFLQNEVVYAAETNEASAPTVTRTELYKNEGAKTTKTIDFSELKEDDWNGEGKITFAYDESINGSLGNVNEEYELTAKVTLDETSYQSLDADKAHLNIHENQIIPVSIHFIHPFNSICRIKPIYYYSVTCVSIPPLTKFYVSYCLF